MRISDWSSDVCSSDLEAGAETQAGGILDEGALVDRAEQAAALQVGCHHRHDVGAELLLFLHLAVEFGQRDRQRLHEALVDIDEIGRASCRESVCQYV